MDKEEKYLNVKSLKGILKENSKGGIKDFSGKIEYSLLPWDSLESVTKILMLGSKKYGPQNWRKVDRKYYVDALFRHLASFMRGEAVDEESGELHLSHAACNILFLIALYGDEAFSIDELGE